MKVELKRDAMLVIPESEQDRAYIEDTLGLKTNGHYITMRRVDDVATGYAKADSFVLKGSNQ